ncbi:hypothetical protein E1193_27975 [Micromonospora sp. KC606]|uniref:hypothetical protein n=1 Tax=Micromonospora sp. KC606 TaxID=2530379 RepID=UPI0010456E14|nr:hypothetical protein [Micromonospora sp. KC606]TDC72318.1 hypothetical protein E1193_27975 [Micromonospora sp. KC606]
MTGGKTVAAQRQAWLVFEDEAGETLRPPKARALMNLAHSSADQQAGGLRRLLHEWDFVGVYNPQTNVDESDCLTGPLLARSTNAADADDLGNYLSAEIRGDSGLPPGTPHHPSFRATPAGLVGLRPPEGPVNAADDIRSGLSLSHPRFRGSG